MWDDDGSMATAPLHPKIPSPIIRLTIHRPDPAIDAHVSPSKDDIRSAGAFGNTTGNRRTSPMTPTAADLAADGAARAHSDVGRSPAGARPGRPVLGPPGSVRSDTSTGQR